MNLSDPRLLSISKLNLVIYNQAIFLLYDPSQGKDSKGEAQTLKFKCES